MERNNAAFPINFARGLTVLFATGTASLDGPWTSVAGGRLPRGPILIWPPRPIGNYTFTKTLAADYGRLFHHMNDSGMMPALIWCESKGLIYNANWVPAQGQWVSHHNLTAVDALTKHLTYTKQGFNRTSSSTCGPVTVAVWRK